MYLLKNIAEWIIKQIIRNIKLNNNRIHVFFKLGESWIIPRV